MAYLIQTRIRSLNAEALMTSRHNRTQWAAVNKPIVSKKQSGSRKTILLLRKNVKLVIKYALLYGVTSIMLGLRKQ